MASPRKRNEQNGTRREGGGGNDSCPIRLTNVQPQPTPSESRLLKVSVVKSTAPTFTSSSFSFSYFPPSSYSDSPVISTAITTKNTGEPFASSSLSHSSPSSSSSSLSSPSSSSSSLSSPSSSSSSLSSPYLSSSLSSPYLSSSLSSSSLSSPYLSSSSSYSAPSSSYSAPSSSYSAPSSSYSAPSSSYLAPSSSYSAPSSSYLAPSSSVALPLLAPPCTSTSSSSSPSISPFFSVRFLTHPGTFLIISGCLQLGIGFTYRPYVLSLHEIAHAPFGALPSLPAASYINSSIVSFFRSTSSSVSYFLYPQLSLLQQAFSSFPVSSSSTSSGLSDYLAKLTVYPSSFFSNISLCLKKNLILLLGGTPPPSLLDDDVTWNLEEAKGLVVNDGQNFPAISVGNDSSNVSNLGSSRDCSSSLSKSSPFSTPLRSTSTTGRAYSKSLRNIATSAEFVGSSVYPSFSSSSSFSLSPSFYLSLKKWKSHYRQREAAFWYTMTSVCLVLTGILILQIHSRQERRWGGRRTKTDKEGSGKEEDVAKKKEMDNKRRHRRKLEGTSSSSENCDDNDERKSITTIMLRESSSSFSRVNGLLLSLLGIVGIVYSSSPTWWIVALQGLRLSL